MVSGLLRPLPGHVGLDEAGRGCLAGPVVAAAVLLPAGAPQSGSGQGMDESLDDSKKLSPRQREKLAGLIRVHALAWGVGYAWPREIERINILQASLTAMGRALSAMLLRQGTAPERAGLPTELPTELRVDGNKLLPTAWTHGLPQTTVVKGDGTERVIAAASILAKTVRDGLLHRLDLRYPGYGLAKHKGYATKQHYAAIGQLGPCRLHRMTFRGVRPRPAPGATERETWLPGI